MKTTKFLLVATLMFGFIQIGAAKDPKPPKFPEKIQIAVKNIYDAVDVLRKYENGQVNEKDCKEQLRKLSKSAEKLIAAEKKVEKNKYRKALYKDALTNLDWAQSRIEKNGLKYRAHIMDNLLSAIMKMIGTLL